MNKILVVDDEPLLRETIQMALSGEGHMILHASNGQRGLAILAEEPIDLVITDLTMPVMGGREFLERLRQDHRNLRCIVMTGQPTPDIVIGALRQHVCELLTKPFTAGQLRASVGSVLSRLHNCEHRSALSAP